MHSVSLDPIISRFPGERQAVKRLENLINEAEKRPASKLPEEYTFDHLLHKTDVSSAETLSLILSELVKQGILQKIVRVESPGTKGGIGDYTSLTEVPTEVFDSRTDRTIRVTPGDLRVIFRIKHA